MRGATGFATRRGLEQGLEVPFAVTGLSAASQPCAHELCCGGAEDDPGSGIVLPCQAFDMITDDDGVLGRRHNAIRQRGDVGGEAVNELVERVGGPLPGRPQPS